MSKNISNLVIVFIILVIVGIFVYNNPLQQTPSSYIESADSIYKVSWECIRKHYADDLTEDGYVFSMYPIKSDCKATFLGDITIKVYGPESPEELSEKSRHMFNEMKRLGGNAIFFESAIRKSTDTDKFIKDMTEIIRQDVLDGKENNEFEIIHDTKTTSV